MYGKAGCRIVKTCFGVRKIYINVYGEHVSRTFNRLMITHIIHTCPVA